MKERILHILCRLIFIVAACPIDASALSSTDVTICNEYNEKSGIATETERDRLGRVTSQITRHNRRRVSEKEYIWGLNDQLLAITNNGKQTLFEYDGWGNLAKATYPDGKVELRNPDKTGNLFETVDRIDRKYSAGGRLEQSADYTYKYDDEGHLTEKRHRVQVQQAWKYHWNSAGMLEEVVRPDGSTVSFKYDALGRRIEKRLFNRKTRWVWDGNVPLHEWNEVYTKDFTEEKGEFYSMKPSKTTTWLFEEGTFVPCGKQVGEESFSIQSNYLGTPEVMYDADGKVVWSAELSSYGDVRNLTGERGDCPFRYQGQYEDKETGLYYNRFRYYSVEEGMYICQDPIGLLGGKPNLYGYVKDTNTWLDPFGLSKQSCSGANGVSQAEKDLKNQGFNIVAKEVTLNPGNEKNIRIDILAEKNGKLYGFEVKNGKSQYTNHQSQSGLFGGKSSKANSSVSGNGTVIVGSGKTATTTIETGNTTKLGQVGNTSQVGNPYLGKGDSVGSVEFNTLWYDL